MKENENLLNEFSIEELESRLELKMPWVVYVCPGSECGNVN